LWRTLQRAVASFSSPSSVIANSRARAEALAGTLKRAPQTIGTQTSFRSQRLGGEN